MGGRGWPVLGVGWLDRLDEGVGWMGSQRGGRVVKGVDGWPKGWDCWLRCFSFPGDGNGVSAW